MPPGQQVKVHKSASFVDILEVCKFTTFCDRKGYHTLLVVLVRARKRACAWTGIYTHAVNVHVYVCAQLHNLFFYGALPQTEKMSRTSVKIISMK